MSILLSYDAVKKKDKKEKGEKNFKKETEEKKQKERILGGITKRSY